MENIAIISAVAIIVVLAAFYVYKAKKSGKKCVGCPEGCTCGQSSSCQSKDSK